MQVVRCGHEPTKPTTSKKILITIGRILVAYKPIEAGILGSQNSRMGRTPKEAHATGSQNPSPLKCPEYEGLSSVLIRILPTLIDRTAIRIDIRQMALDEAGLRSAFQPSSTVAHFDGNLRASHGITWFDNPIPHSMLM